MLKVSVDIICVIVEMGLLCYFYNSFFEQCRWGKRGQLYWFTALGIIAFALSSAPLTSMQRSICSLLLDVTATLPYRQNWPSKIFAAGLFLAVQLSCEFFAWIFISFIRQSLPDPIDGHSIENYIQGVFLSKMISVFIIYFFVAFKKKNKYYGKKRLLCAYMIVPVITAISLNQLAYATELVGSQQAHNQFLLIATALILSNVILFYLFDRQMETEKIRQDLELVALRGKLQQEFYSALIQRDLEVSRMNHDMKHHLAILQYQAEEGNLSAVKDYLQELSLAQTKNKVHYTSHDTINGILSIKQETAQKKGIMLDVTIPAVLSLPQISDMDLVIVLANCLDNAIEAVEKIEADLEKRIRVVLENSPVGLSLLVENPVAEVPDMKWLKTTKAEPEKHGLGLKNIRAIVDKYHGELQLDLQDKMFQVKLLLLNEKTW